MELEGSLPCSQEPWECQKHFISLRFFWGWNIFISCNEERQQSRSGEEKSADLDNSRIPAAKAVVVSNFAAWTNSALKHCHSVKFVCELWWITKKT
jgi:hypothetical protein